MGHDFIVDNMYLSSFV